MLEVRARGRLSLLTCTYMYKLYPFFFQGISNQSNLLFLIRGLGKLALAMRTEIGFLASK